MMSPPPFKRKKTDENDIQIHIESGNNNFDDDDDDDISDSDLIRASQMIESRYVNSAAAAQNHISSTLSMARGSFASQLYHNPQMDHTLDTSDTHQLASEIRQLKSENYQKDGEVKILRDKLKKSEFELNKLRNEKMDLVKKFNQQSEDTTKAYKKQIESKELEVQFKTQEILELNMKYKLLESKLRKNSSCNEPLKQVQNINIVQASLSENVVKIEPKFEVAKAPKMRKFQLKTTKNCSNNNSSSLKEALINFLIVDSSESKTMVDKVNFVSQDGLVKVVYFFIDLFKYCIKVFESNASEVKLHKLLVFLKELIGELNHNKTHSAQDFGKIHTYLRSNISLISNLLSQIDAFLVKLSLSFANKNANSLLSLSIQLFLYFFLLESKLLKQLGSENCSEIDKFRCGFEARRLNLFHLVNHLTRIRPSMHLFASVVNILNELEMQNETEIIEILHNFPDIGLGSLIENSSTQLGPCNAINTSSLASILSISSIDSSVSAANSVCFLAVFHEKLTKFLADDVYLSEFKTFSGCNEFLASYLSYLELVTQHKAHLNGNCACFKEVLFCFLILSDYLFNEAFLNKRDSDCRRELCMSDALLMLHNRALALFIKLNQQLNCGGADENLFDAILKDDYRFKNLVCLMHLVDTHMNATHSFYLNLSSLKAAFSRLSYFDI